MYGNFTADVGMLFTLHSLLTTLEQISYECETDRAVP